MFFCKLVMAAWRSQLRCACGCLLCFFIVIPNVVGAQSKEERLTLPSALSRVIERNPSLKVFNFRLKGIKGLRVTADQSPAYEAGLQVENAFGSGAFHGLEQAEYTLSLSSVIELGDKRRARVNAVSSRYALVDAQREAETLDLLGKVTQRYVVALALQEKLGLAEQAVALNEATLNIAERRVKQGASPNSEVLRARAALAQSRISQAALITEFDIQKTELASFWGDTQANFKRLEGNLFRVEPGKSFDLLYQRVSRSPMIRVYASEKRMRDAQVKLAQSESETDIRWQLGARRHEATGDTALVVGLSVPLFTERRNRGEVQAALAARDEVAYRRQEALLEVHSLLFDAYQTRQHSISAVEQFQSLVIPTLTEALTLTQKAYESGRYSYLEWVSAQRDLLGAREAMVEAAAKALLNQVLIEELTAQPLMQP